MARGRGDPARRRGGRARTQDREHHDQAQRADPDQREDPGGRRRRPRPAPRRATGRQRSGEAADAAGRDGRQERGGGRDRRDAELRRLEAGQAEHPQRKADQGPQRSEQGAPTPRTRRNPTTPRCAAPASRAEEPGRRQPAAGAEEGQWRCRRQGRPGRAEQRLKLLHHLPPGGPPDGGAAPPCTPAPGARGEPPARAGGARSRRPGPHRELDDLVRGVGEAKQVHVRESARSGPPPASAPAPSAAGPPSGPIRTAPPGS